VSASQGINTEQLSEIAKQARERLSFIAVIPAQTYRNAILALATLWLLWLLADLFWLLMPAPAASNMAAISSSTNSSARKNVANNNNQQTVDLAKIQGWHLFGETNKAEEASETFSAAGDDVDENAEETRLSLTLVGLIEAKDPAMGYAIIEYQSKSDLYKVGQTLPAGNSVTLSKVLSDRAIIDNRGKYEAIFLYDEKGNRIQAPARNNRKAVKAEPADSNDKRVIDQRGNRRLSKMAADYRQQLINDPMSLAEVIKISPASDSDGKLMGYRVRPGKHRQQFKDFGLKPGDIVTSVNGVALTDPSNAMSLYQDMQNTTEASIEVLRGDETISLMIGIE
jgi:general secretion pathway protein C